MRKTIAWTPKRRRTERWANPKLVVPVGRANGLQTDGVVSCDNIVTVPTTALEGQIGFLLPAQEDALTTAIHAAFDLD